MSDAIRPPPGESSGSAPFARTGDVAMRSLLDALPAAVYATDPLGRITYYNQAAARLWGRAPAAGDDQWCGSWKLYWPDGRPLSPEESPMALAVRERRPIRGIEVVLERPDGVRVPVMPFATPLFGEGDVLRGAVHLLVDVSERKTAEAQEQRLAAIVASSDDAIVSKDLDGTIRSWNRAAQEIFGYSAEEAIGQNILMLFPPERRSEEIFIMDRIRRGLRVEHYETVRVRKDGTKVDVSLTVSPIHDRAGTVIGASKIARGVGARKRTEAQLRRQTRRAETLNRVARVISQELDLERAVKLVTDIATELTGARYGAFFYNALDADNNEAYRLYTLSGAPYDAFANFGMPRNTKLFEPTFRGTAVVRSGDIRKDARYGSAAPHFGLPEGHLPVVSYLAVPVIARGGQVLGGLFFAHDEADVFTEEAEELIAGVAVHAAIAIENARLHGAAQREIERNRRMQAASARLAAIVESSDDAILAKDLDGIITDWNKAAERLFGYTAEEAIGQPVTMLIPEECEEEEPDILGRIRRGEPVEHYETVRRRKDGTLVDIAITVSPIFAPDGTVIGASKIARDITEQRRAQEQQELLLREMNHRIKNLFALAASVVALSARTAETPKELAVAVRQRLNSLARAHALTIAGPGRETMDAPASLHELIAAIASPYRSEAADEARIRVSGDDLALSSEAVTPFALLLHEFATNAAKYGALSTEDGRIEIACRDDGENVVVHWAEHGGPPLEGAASDEGFGTLLARVAVEGQLGGTIHRDWHEGGLAIRLAVPRDRVAG